MNYYYLVADEVSAIRENGATSGAGVPAEYVYNNLGVLTRLNRGNGTSTVITPDPVSTR